MIRPHRIPSYFQPGAHFPGHSVDVTCVTGPLMKPAPQTGPDQHDAHLTRDPPPVLSDLRALIEATEADGGQRALDGEAESLEHLQVLRLEARQLVLDSLPGSPRVTTGMPCARRAAPLGPQPGAGQQDDPGERHGRDDHQHAGQQVL